MADGFRSATGSISIGRCGRKRCALGLRRDHYQRVGAPRIVVPSLQERFPGESTGSEAELQESVSPVLTHIGRGDLDDRNPRTGIAIAALAKIGLGRVVGMS